MTINKTVRIGTQPTWGGRRASVYCHIEYDEERKDRGRLSITGVVGPLPSGNCLGSSGQIDNELHRVDRYAPGWDRILVEQLRMVWNRWHLNDLQAGCEHQRADGKTYQTHPDEPCPHCGYYKLGHAWLVEEVPGYVLEFLSGLPDADQKPAWV